MDRRAMMDRYTEMHGNEPPLRNGRCAYCGGTGEIQVTQQSYTYPAEYVDCPECVGRDEDEEEVQE
jgi:excinuclease UvrABC ATPase subunit